MMLAFAWEGSSVRETSTPSAVRLQTACALPKKDDLTPAPTVPQTRRSASVRSVAVSFRPRVQNGREQIDPSAVSIPGVNS